MFYLYVNINKTKKHWKILKTRNIRENLDFVVKMCGNYHKKLMIYTIKLTEKS